MVMQLSDQRVRFWVAMAAVMLLISIVAYPLPTGFEARLFWSVAVVAELPLLLLPAAALTYLAERLPGGRHWSPAVAIASASATVAVMLVNARIVSLYGFGINGFVWNLLTTPGGLRSLGATEDTWVTAIFVGMLVIALTYVLWRASAATRGWRLPVRQLAVGCCLLLVCEKALYAVSMFSGVQPVIDAARYVPFYVPVTSASLLARLLPRTERGALGSTPSSTFNYPTEPIRLRPPAKPPNILWLVAESWRADALRPDIMPHTVRFADDAWRFSHHYSGGNGTRMGMFTMFYGIPGSYWFAALQGRVPPVFTDVLRREGYQFAAYTSTTFSYPEFDSTVFAGLRGDELFDDSTGAPWQRDRQNVARMVGKIEHWDDRPHFMFMFFESTHAPYVVAPDTIAIPDYLHHFDYARTDIAANIDGIHNRYLNTVYHLDAQIGRLLDALRRTGHIEDTIVVITGDHGEAFMEDGRWGHNSALDQTQLHVPLIVRLPGESPRLYAHDTCHEDIVATLLPRLGVRNARQTYTTGHLLTDVQPRRVILAADWARLGLLTEDYTAVFPYRVAGIGRSSIRYRSDHPGLRAELTRDMATVLPKLSRFSGTGGTDGPLSKSTGAAYR